MTYGTYIDTLRLEANQAYIRKRMFRCAGSLGGFGPEQRGL